MKTNVFKIMCKKVYNCSAILMLSVIAVVQISCSTKENTTYSPYEYSLNITSSETLKKGTIIPWNEVYKISHNDYFIHLFGLQKKYFPKVFFDANMTENAVNAITQYYGNKSTPYDSTYFSKVWEEENEIKFSKIYDQERIEEINNEYLNKYMQDPNMIAVKRKDFWKDVFRINRKYINPKGLRIIEKAIKESHEALELDWNDTIYVDKVLLDAHRATIISLFKEKKDNIGEIYLKRKGRN